jgi:hypothetical protein
LYAAWLPPCWSGQRASDHETSQREVRSI